MNQTYKIAESDKTISVPNQYMRVSHFRCSVGNEMFELIDSSKHHIYLLEVCDKNRFSVLQFTRVSLSNNDWMFCIRYIQTNEFHLRVHPDHNNKLMEEINNER